MFIEGHVDLAPVLGQSDFLVFGPGGVVTEYGMRLGFFEGEQAGFDEFGV